VLPSLSLQHAKLPVNLLESQAPRFDARNRQCDGGRGERSGVRKLEAQHRAARAKPNATEVGAHDSAELAGSGYDPASACTQRSGEDLRRVEREGAAERGDEEEGEAAHEDEAERRESAVAHYAKEKNERTAVRP
jgi:hypothetical protein